MAVLRAHVLPAQAPQLEVHAVPVRALQHALREWAADVVIHSERGREVCVCDGGVREDRREDVAVFERLADARALVRELRMGLDRGQSVS